MSQRLGKCALIACAVVGFVSASVSVWAAPQDKQSGIVRVLVSAENESVLAAQMAGRIVAINAKLGDRIRKGETLLSFDCDEQEARLNMAKAESDGADKVLEAKLKLQAMESASVLEVSQATAEAGKFKAQIQLYQAQMRLCNIAAPFSGRVTRLRSKAFESVTVGQPLLEVVNDERLKLQLNVPSVWLTHVKAGNPFNVTIDETGKTYAARVRRVNGKVDAVSQSIELEGELTARAAELLPGMSGTADFQDAQKR
jgi:RND family efflux transporter MFP subunit